MKFRTLNVYIENECRRVFLLLLIMPKNTHIYIYTNVCQNQTKKIVIFVYTVKLNVKSSHDEIFY